jgi:NADH:ubiquinone oxidoreductase subunit 6 (subunit J)
MIITIVKIGMYTVMALSLLAALGAVSLPNIFHAALALIVVLVGSAALFIALGADFLGFVQILLYVGAVMTLVIFAIMMTHQPGATTVPSKNKLVFPGLIAVSAILGILTALIYKTPWLLRPENTLKRVTVSDLGQALMGPYALPFELISVVLIAALVGAVVVAKKDKS